jgi:hypothetical protein
MVTWPELSSVQVPAGGEQPGNSVTSMQAQLGAA